MAAFDKSKSKGGNEGHFDVCIIGAGPAGLSVLSALRNPKRLLTDTQLQTRNLSNIMKDGKDGKCEQSICVIDPGGRWLTEWNGRGEALSINFLRSPALMTPDYNNNAGLTRFASTSRRESELKDVEIPRDASQELRGHIDAGLFKLPGSALFKSFCDDIVMSLPHTFITGSVCDVKKTSGEDIYELIGPEGTILAKARHTIYALGPSCAPNIPQQITCIYDKSKKASQSRVIHTFAWKQLKKLPFKNETVVVIGGGLSAVQTVLLASERGARRVVLVSRRPLRSRLLDLSIDWFNPQAGWRTRANHNKSKKRGEKFRMYEFYDTPKGERKEWVRSARDGATVPPYYLKELDCAAKKTAAGIIDRYVDEIDTACFAGSGNEDESSIRVTFRHGSAPLFADRIILATGSSLDVDSVPLLRSVIERFQLPLADGLPDLDDNLQWGANENFSVVGALALMQIGPEAGNLSGCRRCAERCASHLGVFDAIYEEKGGILKNIYAAFSDSDDDSDGD